MGNLNINDIEIGDILALRTGAKYEVLLIYKELKMIDVKYLGVIGGGNGAVFTKQRLIIFKTLYKNKVTNWKKRIKNET